MSTVKLTTVGNAEGIVLPRELLAKWQVNKGDTFLIRELPDPTAILKIPGAHFHAYGKALRPGRKVSHVTLRADNLETLQDRLTQFLLLVEH